MDKLNTPETSITFVKPPFIKETQEVYRHLDTLLSLETSDIHTTNPILIHPSRELMEAHYAHVMHLPFAKSMIDGFYENGIVIRAYTGTGIVEDIIHQAGPTDPSEGQSWQIRHYFSDDVLATAVAEGRSVKNVIHRSGSIEEGRQELERFNNFLN